MYINKMLLVFFLLGITIFCGCGTVAESEVREQYKFIFLGHIYNWSNSEGNTVDDRVEKIVNNNYDGYWLGGDICAHTSLDPRTFDYLDSLFDLANINSHFALGNHDVRDNNLDAYYKVTKRPDFYTSTFHNLVVSVLNTNINSSDCEALDAQFQMLMNVCDTIQTSSHYVMLMHHQLFSGITGIESFKSNGDLQYYAMNCLSSDSYFNSTVYPKLVKLEKKGIEVIVVVGDTGWHKGCEEECTNGITFLASGINNSHYIGKAIKAEDLSTDKVLIFNLDIKERTLDWEFQELNKLAGINLSAWLANK